MAFGADHYAAEKIGCEVVPGGVLDTQACILKIIETAWGAKVFDHTGATEIGAWSYECATQPGGMHVNDAFSLVEIEDIESGEMIQEPDHRGKMIITALDRLAQPCIRLKRTWAGNWNCVLL